MINDTDIINAVRRDPENGFRILLKEKWEPVYWHIRRLVIHHNDAQDATQETFIKDGKAVLKACGKMILIIICR